MNDIKRINALLLAALVAALAFASVVLAGEEGVAEDGPARLSALSWMTGHWAGESGEVRSEEWWTPAAGGVMLGLHRDVGTEGDAFFEFLRVVESESNLVYLAQPMGRPPTEFRMVRLDESEVVFENRAHDFPQRIIYSLDTEGRLVARVEGDVGGETRSSQWRWSRVE